MNLLPGERILLESDNQALVLTSHRVRLTVQTTGLTKITSIMLEELSACEITSISKPWLLVLAMVAFLMGLYFNTSGHDSSSITGGVVVAMILVLAYFGTRQGVIMLSATGTEINAPIRGMSKEVATNFIDTVESAKNDRYFAVRRSLASSV